QWKPSTIASPKELPLPVRISSRLCCRVMVLPLTLPLRGPLLLPACTARGLLRITLQLAAVWAVIFASTITSAAQAACTGVVAERVGPVHLAAAVPMGAVSITFLGHASFLIESAAGVRIVTDYNDAIRAPITPDIVTMNNAHPTHYSDAVEPGVKYILRG